MSVKPGPHGIKGTSYRPPYVGGRGAVVANHPLAAEAGMRTLQKGGNTVDAMISVAFSLGVAEPSGSSVGGDGFIMVNMADKGTIEVANGTGAAPLAATPDNYTNGIPMTGFKSVSVPGIVDALLAVHEKYGSLTLETCIEPAIELCEDGVPVSYFQSENAKTFRPLIEYPTSAEVFAPQGKWLKPGDKRHNQNLAKTYKKISKRGRDEFYLGDTAKAIVKFSEETGGFINSVDLSRHSMKWQNPISTNYRDKVIYEAPPNSSGHVLLQELNLLENFDLSEMDYMSPDLIHLMVEAKKLSFADREEYLADPDFVDVPIDGLISKEYSYKRSQLIFHERSLNDPSAGDPWAFMNRPPNKAKKHKINGRLNLPGGETTHYCIVDRWGNSLSALQSIQTGYGSGMLAGNTGILMNNRMTYWHLDPNHIDYLNPGQRVRHTMNPVMVLSDPVESGGSVELVCGTPGADTQVQTNFQIISAIYDHGLNIAEAIEGPRWTHYQGTTSSTYPHTEENFLHIENRVDNKTVDSLSNKGHLVISSGEFGAAGCAGGIQIIGKNRSLFAASDLRREGYSIVW